MGNNTQVLGFCWKVVESSFSVTRTRLECSPDKRRCREAISQLVMPSESYYRARNKRQREHSELTYITRQWVRIPQICQTTCFSTTKLSALAPLILRPIWTCFHPLRPNTGCLEPGSSPLSLAMCCPFSSSEAVVE